MITTIIKALPGGFEADWAMTFTDRYTGEEYTTWGADDVDSIPDDAENARAQAEEYWQAVAEDIEKAEEHEGKAEELLNDGQLEEAAQEIEKAAELERKHGDAGTYEHVLGLLTLV